MDPYLVELFDAMAMPNSIWALGPLKVEITPEENRYAWKSDSAYVSRVLDQQQTHRQVYPSPC